MLKRLFTINYNGKKILILSDDNHRKSFLELTKDGKYMYPTYEDYKILCNIYNNIDYTIRTMTFKEKVRYKAGLLFVTVTLSSLLSSPKFTVDEDGKILNVNYLSQYELIKRDSNSLALAYGDELITRDDVVDAINENDNLNDKYKTIAILVMDNLISLDPEINLRIYYENIKELKVIELTYDKLVEKCHQNAAGCFISSEHTIYIANEYSYDYSVIAHEFTHAAYNIIDVVDDKKIMVADSVGYSLDEAMTQRIITSKWGNNGAYNLQQVLLNYFILNLHNFNYHMYNEDSILALVDELKREYPSVDIDYIIDYIDAMTSTKMHFGEIPELTESKEFCSELFKIAIRNIDCNNVYQSFNNFMTIFDNIDIDFYNMYYNLYNQELIKLGLISHNDFNIVSECDKLIAIGNNFYLGNTQYYIDYDGNKVGIHDSVAFTYLPINDYIKARIINNCVLDTGIFTREYINSLLTDENILDANILKYIHAMNDADKKALVDKIFTFITTDIDRENLYGKFDVITNFLRADIPLYNEYYNYLERYDNILAAKYSLDPKMISDIRNIKCFIKYDGSIYPCINSYQENGYSQLIHRGETQIGSLCTQISFGNQIKYFYIKNTGWYNEISFDDNLLEYYTVNELGINKIIECVINNGIDNIWSNTGIEQVFDSLNINNQKKCYTLNGKKIDTNGYYIEIGSSHDNDIGIILYDDNNNYVYGTTKSLNGNTYQLSFDDFVRIGDGEITSLYQIEAIISNKYINTIPKLSFEYMIPNVSVMFNEESYYTDSGGLALKYSKDIVYNNPQRINVDNNIDYARRIYLYTDNNGNLKIHFSFDKDLTICNLSDCGLMNSEYFISFDKCLQYYGMNDSEYTFSRNQIIEIMNNYLMDVYIKNSKTHIK